jgi:hypothetical protein
VLRDFHTVIMLLSGNDAEVAQAVLRTAGAALLSLVLSLLDGKRATLIRSPRGHWVERLLTHVDCSR